MKDKEYINNISYITVFVFIKKPMKCFKSLSLINVMDNCIII